MKEKNCYTESKESSSLTTADVPVEYLPQQVSIGTQSDLTAASIRAVEADYQQQVSESAQVVTRIKGFPDLEDFKMMKTLYWVGQFHRTNSCF